MCTRDSDPAAPGDAEPDIRGSDRTVRWSRDGNHAPELPTDRELLELPPLDAFLSTLNLVDTGARTSNDIFTGPSLWMPFGRVFGGQVIAQSIVAALRTIEGERPIHSMHGYFLRPGDIHEPITFSVDRTHDGNSFTTRSVRAFQKGETIFAMIASFQAPEPGLEHTVEMPSGYPPPESLPSEAPLVEEAGEALANSWVHRRPFAMRHVEPPIYLEPDESRARRQAVWVKAIGEMPDDPIAHQAALAFVSDYVLLEPILRAHGLAWIDRRLRVASLDHAMWWHRDVRVDEWLLYVAETSNAQGGRGLSTGRFFTRHGEHVATVAQEGMVRLKGVEHAG